MSPTDPLDPFNLPPIDLKITSTDVKASPRQMNWSPQAADDFRSAFGIEGSGPKMTPLMEITKALDDPDYDPADPESVAEWRAKHRKKGLIESMADEMTAEIDREIAREIAKAPAQSSSTTTPDISSIRKNAHSKIGIEIGHALKKARQGEVTPDLSQKIRTLLHQADLDQSLGMERAIHEQVEAASRELGR